MTETATAPPIAWGAPMYRLGECEVTHTELGQSRYLVRITHRSGAEVVLGHYGWALMPELRQAIRETAEGLTPDEFQEVGRGE